MVRIQGPRGGRPARRRGVRTRGGRGARGLPRQRPSAIDRLHVMNLEDLSARESLERPLVPKKMRVSKPNNNEHLRDPAFSWLRGGQEINPAICADADLLSGVNLPEEEMPPSPAMYMECGGSSSSTPSSRYDVQVSILEKLDAAAQAPSSSQPNRARRTLYEEQPSSSTMLPTVSARRRPITEADIMELLHIGSDEEEEAEEEDDALIIPPIPRVVQSLWETPEDEDDVCVPATTSATPNTTPLTQLHATPEEQTDRPIHFPNDFFDFKWSEFPTSPVSPTARREPFSNIHSGPNITVSEPYQIFTEIWDREFVQYIADETNRYAQHLALELIYNNKLKPTSRITGWTDVTADDIYVFFAILLATGMVVKSRIEEYWNTQANIFNTPGFRVFMPLRRFQLISSYLHFNNSEEMYGQNLSAADAKLFKVEPVIKHLNNKFSNMYTLHQNITLGESLLQWKGWLHINQFVPNKAARVGIKSYEICESQTGYLWRFSIHANNSEAGLQNRADPLTAHTPALVLKLVQGLEHVGYTLWMDSYYNSPALARKLKSVGIDCVGTLRTNRQFIPQELQNLKQTNLRPGQVVGFTSGDVDVMVCRDRNRVATISTYHGNAVSNVDGILKPMIIRDYNICMGGVDKKDQLLASYPVERKHTRIWYKKLFRRLLNVSVLNSHIIHKCNSSNPLTHRAFRNELILCLLNTHGLPAPILPAVPSASSTSASTIYEAKHHFPQEYPFLSAENTRNRQRRLCKVCRKRTITYCAGCSQPVCAFKCFSSLHS